jgi:predicted RNase H-like HicB family nuclease
MSTPLNKNLTGSTQQMISYRILLKKEPEEGYTVTVPSLPGCVTYGKSIEEAIEMAKEAIELYLESLKSHNEEIPNPSISNFSESYKDNRKKS